METYSAIDIGSNAIRMILVEKDELTYKKIHVLKKFRAALRLGQQVFLTKKIDNTSLKKAVSIFEDFQKNNKKFKVIKCKAVATSATREATNGLKFVEAIKKKTGIQIEIIDGIQEAQLIHLAVKMKYDLSDKNTMLIDIGGGSVEVTFSQNAQMISSQSFPLGTVRLMDQIKKRKYKNEHYNLLISEHLGALTKHIHAHIDKHPVSFAIGTGGNLEYLLFLRNLLWPKTKKNYFTYKELQKMIEIIKSLTIKERIQKLKMKKDRADVILPASLVLQTTLHQAEVTKVYIPKVGLREGVIWSMF